MRRAVYFTATAACIYGSVWWIYTFDPQANRPEWDVYGIAVPLAVLGFAFFFVACSDRSAKTHKGTVIERRFTVVQTESAMEPDSQSQTGWALCVASVKGRKRWIHVQQETFERHHVGSRYPDAASN